MNKLFGIITEIQKSGPILLVDVDVEGQGFSALLIEAATHPEWLKRGNGVYLVFKETEVSLAKELSGKISFRNRMGCKILKIEKGDILSTITLNFQHYALTSAITTRAVTSLQLVIGDSVEALVKSNEVSLMNAGSK